MCVNVARCEFLASTTSRSTVGRHLAGGEAQRIRLASQIGSGLVSVLYVLDEPSIGLHQRDDRKLIDTLIRLRDLGNTVIVVEHDEDTIPPEVVAKTPDSYPCKFLADVLAR